VTSVDQVSRFVDDQAPMDQLANLLEGERKNKALSSKNISTRHSRFGTTIQVKAVSLVKTPSVHLKLTT
jgi:hypothetical protein